MWGYTGYVSGAKSGNVAGSSVGLHSERRHPLWLLFLSLWSRWFCGARSPCPSLFFSSFFTSLFSGRKVSSWGNVCLSSSCTLRVTNCCLATKLHFQGRIWLVQMEPDLIYNRPGSSITNKVARSPLSWKSNSLWSLRNGRYSNRFLLKQFKMIPNVMKSWVRELASWSEEYVPANQKPLGFGNFWDLSL